MPFIGNQPAKVPLTSADITDGIIVNADIASGAAIALTKLASTGTLTVDNIQFPATQVASSNANNLDDYEEGTFTVSITGGSTAGSATYTTRIGRYIKIGKLVTVYGYVRYNSHTGSGGTQITGLPFTTANVTDAYGAVSLFLHDITLPASTYAQAVFVPNTTRIDIYTLPVGGGAVSGLAIDAQAEIGYSATYEATS